MAYLRRDDWVNNGFGQPVPNVAVTYYVQSGMVPATVYSDSAGTPAANPQLTDGVGHAIAFLGPSTYAITYSGLQIQTLTLTDQVVTPLTSLATAPNVPIQAPDGVRTTFTLPVAATNPTAAQGYLSGSFIPYGTVYTISGTTLTWVAVLPPQLGDTLEFFYV